MIAIGVLFVAAIAIAWLIVGTIPVDCRQPVAFFVVVYVVTNLLCSYFYCIRETLPLYDAFLFASGAILSRIPSADVKYYLMVLLPLWIVPFVATMVVRLRLRRFNRLLDRTPALDFGAFCMLAAGALLYCGVRLLSSGVLSQLGAASGDYAAAVQQRYAAFAEIGPVGLGFIYVGIPTLCTVALFEAHQTRKPQWLLATGILVAAEAALAIGTFQKSIILVFGLQLLVALQALGAIGRKHIAAAVVGGIALLTLMQVYVLGAGWGVLDTVNLIAFRAGSATPYYIAAYPNQIPFSGIDWQGLLFGKIFVGQGTSYTTDVFDYMYGASAPVRGASPANAFVSAYAEGGLGYAVLVMCIVGGLAGAAAQYTRRSRDNSLRFGLYIGLIGTLYYVTQVQLTAAIWLSYGLKWTVFTVGSLAVLQQLHSERIPRIPTSLTWRAH